MFKIPRVQPRTISRLLLGSPGKMCHSDVAPTGSYKEYYMGEGGGFPRIRAVVSQVCQSARGLSQHPRVFPECELTLLWLVLDADSSLII